MPLLRTESRTPFIALLAVALVAFAPGLVGPFVLDDHSNLAGVWSWLRGDRSTVDTVLGVESGPLRRPLAYLSFVFNAAIGGASPFGFKLVNLILHLLAGFLAFQLLLRLLPRDTRLPAAAAWVVAGLWLLHPIQVSTVHYVVQRMAILSAIGQLAALLSYVHGRWLLESGQVSRGRLWLFLAFPICVGLGLAAKENAILAIPLAVLIEYCYFRAPRPREIRFFALTLFVVPVLLAIIFVAFNPSWVGAGYAAREFEWDQRLMTQARVLFDYARLIALPLPSDFGLYREGYGVSTGLWSPPATSLCMLFWVALMALAWAVRKRAPSCLAGLAFFLVGHALESSVYPLEMYFEHRNYLPSLGLLLALVAALAPLLQTRSRSAQFALVAAPLLGLAAISAWRSYQWGDFDRMLATEGPPPGEVSRRLQVDRAIRAVEMGRTPDSSLDVLDTGNRGDRAAGQLWRTIFRCDLEHRVPTAELEALRARGPSVMTHNHVSALELLGTRAVSQRCEGVSRESIQTILDTWERELDKPVAAGNLHRLRALRERLRSDR